MIRGHVLAKKRDRATGTSRKRKRRQVHRKEEEGGGRGVHRERLPGDLCRSNAGRVILCEHGEVNCECYTRGPEERLSKQNKTKQNKTKKIKKINKWRPTS